MQWQALVVRHGLDFFAKDEGGLVKLILVLVLVTTGFIELCFVVFGASEMTRLIDDVPIMLTAHNC